MRGITLLIPLTPNLDCLNWIVNDVQKLFSTAVSVSYMPKSVCALKVLPLNVLLIPFIYGLIIWRDLSSI